MPKKIQTKNCNLPITTQRYHLKIDIQEIQKLQDNHSTKGQKQRQINETKIGQEKRYKVLTIYEWNEIGNKGR